MIVQELYVRNDVGLFIILRLKRHNYTRV